MVCQQDRFASSTHRLRAAVDAGKASDVYRAREIERLEAEQAADMEGRVFMPFAEIAMAAFGRNLDVDFLEVADVAPGFEDHEWVPRFGGFYSYKRGELPDAWVEPVIEQVDRARQIDEWAVALEAS